MNFSFRDMFGGLFGTEGLGGAVSMGLGVVIAMLLGGCVAAAFAYLIGLPVLRLKSDYLAIATLGFAEIIKAIAYRLYKLFIHHFQEKEALKYHSVYQNPTENFQEKQHFYPTLFQLVHVLLRLHFLHVVLLAYF